MKGFTQQDMADSLFIRVQAYQRYESGEREPGFDKLVQIAKKLEVSTDYLLGLTGEEPFDESQTNLPKRPK